MRKTTPRNYNIMKIHSFISYIPVSYDKEHHTTASPGDWDNRRLVWGFKDGVLECTEKVAELVCNYLLATYTSAELKGMSLFCCPASTKRANKVRYHYFTKLVVKRTGMQILDVVNYIEDGEAVHNHGKKHAQYAINKNEVSGTRVVLFDDITTTHKTLTNWGRCLISHGAKILDAVTLGRSIYR